MNTRPDGGCLRPPFGRYRQRWIGLGGMFSGVMEATRRAMTTATRCSATLGRRRITSLGIPIGRIAAGTVASASENATCFLQGREGAALRPAGREIPIGRDQRICARETRAARRKHGALLALLLAPLLASTGQTASTDLCDTLGVSLLCLSECLAVNECINEGGGGCSNQMSELSSCKVAHPYSMGPQPLTPLPPSGVATTPPPDEDEGEPEEDWDCGPLMANLETSYDKCKDAAKRAENECRVKYTKRGAGPLLLEAIMSICANGRSDDEKQCAKDREDTYDTFPPSCPSLPDVD